MVTFHYNFYIVLGLPKLTPKKHVRSKGKAHAVESSSEAESEQNTSRRKNGITPLKSLNILTQKRAAPTVNYSEGARCPLPGCDSKGEIGFV